MTKGNTSFRITMSRPKPDRAPWTQTPPPPVRWRSWPLGESLLGSLRMLAGLGATGLIVGQLTGHTHLAVLAAAAVAVSAWRFFVPTTFELNADGLHQWVLGWYCRVPWSRIRRYKVQAQGVLLLPYSDRCPIDAFRGLYLPWGGCREELLAHFRYQFSRPAEL